ncbi:MAG: 16S rRNA (cytidine(1402)-2'-O)-methyltransferase [Blastocatellia bacterium]|jgi:16S rRNA (cytidine1402-2'-O)-methyltransferase
MPLFLVSTPIGNLEDITFRALRVLKEAALIACEDTRHTGRLLAHFGITTPTISYHEHNERIRAAELVVRLEEGQSIALVTDAGTPGISDPAYRLVVAAIEAGIDVVPIPGPTAFVAALIASGLPTDSFLFVGFLPPRKQARRTRLEEMRDQRATLVLYEAPHRIGATLVDALDVLGDRPAALARELTKLHEQFRRGTLAELLQRHQNDPPRGEIVLIIGGYSGDERDQSIEISSRPLADEVDQLIADQALARNEALRLVARRRGIPRREAYRLYIEEREVDDVVEDEPD